MAEVEDDELWNSDDFIATVEGFLQKAEQDSAVRHATQSFAPSGSAFAAAVLPTYLSRALDGAAFSATPRLDANSSRLSDFRAPNGSSGPSGGSSRDFVDGPKSANVSQLNGNAPRPSHQLGQRLLQPLNHEKLWRELGPKDVHGSRQSKVLDQNCQGHLQRANLEKDDQKSRDLLVEKDGAISLLRTRLAEADQQIDELRKKAGSQHGLQPALFQQREMERLSAQLLFKDHELSEAKRVRLEKEERLQEALAESAALKEELECLKKSRQTDADQLNQSRKEADYNQVSHCQMGCVTSAPESPRITKQPAEVSKQGQGPWLPAQIAEGSQQRSLNASVRISDAPKVGGVLQACDVSPAVATLKLRITENGCVTSNGEEHSESNMLKANELYKRETTAGVGAGTSVRGHGPFPDEKRGLNSSTRMCELSYSLQQIWHPKGPNNDGKALLAKIYAGCGSDLCVLLTCGESQNAVDRKREENGGERNFELHSISEKLHNAIAKVTTGLAHPELLLGPVLEFCKVDNGKKLGSALCVLHCILHHDATCRQRLLGRKSQGRANGQVQLLHSSNVSRKQDTCGEEESWHPGVPKNTKNDVYQSSQMPLFSSPRIIFRPKGKDAEAQSTGGRRVFLEKSSDDVLRGKWRHSYQQEQRTRLESDDSGLENTQAVGKEAIVIVNWMLQLASTHTSPIVRFEAVGIIGVLVVHSEPLVDRRKFGQLLGHGGITLLMKESAGLEIQLQAVRIVHLLLHCPSLFRKLSAGADKDVGNLIHLVETSVVKLPDLKGNSNEISVDHKMDGFAMEGDDSYEGCSELSKAKLLEGMAECLKYTGSSPQGYALRRSAMRLLSFIAFSGDAGVALLMRPLTYHDGHECTKLLRESRKTEGVRVVEVVSAQQVGGRGPSSLQSKVVDTVGSSLGNDSMETGQENVHNIPQRLVTLINSELDIDSQDQDTESSIAEERGCLIREVLTLLCRLSSHSIYSGVVLGFLTTNKYIARLTLGVSNRVISRSCSQLSRTREGQAGYLNSDIIELAKGLRQRVCRVLEESQESV